MSGRQRVEGAAAFLLHEHPYSESSLILEVFARDYGRLALLARGARRPRAQLRGVLMVFQPLLLSWFGSAEVKTLARAEWIGGLPFLRGEALLLGYYLNELLLRLTPREDPHPALYEAYLEIVTRIAQAAGSAARARELRRFEKILLAELGYAPRLTIDALGAPVVAERSYRYQIERGPVPHEEAEGGIEISGASLLALAHDELEDARALAEAKHLMRALIQHQLGDQPLRTRRVFIELQDL
ncbi:MAG: DNA repair protein RecO [Rhodocyclaceae bacterium]|nr:DNA repair protein RecO [Rhodocyclaceae bacterium]